MRLATRLDGLDAHTYVMMGDGEMGEGQNWEAVGAAAKYKLSNLTAIIDQNGYQQTGDTHSVLDLKPFAAKFEAFGWHAMTIEGNSMEAVVEALKKVPQTKDRPTVIVSQTKKGFGILPVLETTGDLNYHGKPLSKELAEKALALLA
ncbi:MAG: thiamine pyrophosphate-dependent enzyme [Polyangiaceae bacterium]